ncbi:MAG: discoidin domain-containing protein [Planctomycetota bacterium]
MTAARRLKRRISGAVVVLAVLAGTHVAQAQPAHEETASSEFRSGYGALQAADGIAEENGNYWQTLEGQDKGAWWQQDLGQVFDIQGVKITWARYQDKVHCPPASAVVETSLTGKEGSWKDVRTIGPDEIPRDGQPYEDARESCCVLPEETKARYVRLLFPEGGQEGAQYEGYLCLGEVEVQAPGLTPHVVTLEGPFGKAEVNVTWPALVRLYLRGPDGRLNAQSLLADTRHPRWSPHGRFRVRRPWAEGGCTYVVGQDQTRYESRLDSPENVQQSAENGGTVVRLTGVKLTAGKDEEAVATEDWTLSVQGEELVWEIVRRWQRDLTCVMSGSPGLFFSFDAIQRKNSVTSTIWYDPFHLAARSSPMYALIRRAVRSSESDNLVQTVRDRDTWAIYKLWTNWHGPSDLRLEVEGGHLYRRGSYAFLNEAGAVTACGAAQTHTAGQVEQITLKIGAVDKQTTGYQLAVTLPDKETEASLKDFYGSVLNGGAVNDQKGFDFGNETDGVYYAGSSWMYGMALAAGIPAAGRLSSRPYDAASAMREHLAHIFSTLDDAGRAHFGFNHGGQWVDDNLHTIIGTRAYLLHSGDLAFVRQNLPALERMLDYFVRRRNDQGLFKLDNVGAHWYYDAVRTSGVNGYYNAFFYKAAGDLAEMEEAAGAAQKAGEYRTLAESIRVAFNEILWREDLPGGPRYLDWIDAGGQPVAYFCDLCQWPPIAVGIASAEQARKIVATADARIAELAKQYGYQGFASLSALWPVPSDHTGQAYGSYMNGGTLLCQTYWEILGRARAGDAQGAYHRLRRFAERARETSWAGDNAFTIAAEPKGDGEPYLADMVVVTAAAIHGILGITPTWDRLEVTPCLPKGWPGAQAELLYKGRRHRVKIEGEKVHIEPLEQVLDVPLLWVMDWNLQTCAGAVAEASNIDFGNRSFVALEQADSDRAASGTYQSPPYDWAVPAKLNDLTVAAELSHGEVTATVQTSNDGFQTVRSEVQIPVRDGVNTYPLDSLEGAPRAVRVRLDLVRGKETAATPVVDGFRITGKATGETSGKP